MVPLADVNNSYLRNFSVCGRYEIEDAEQLQIHERILQSLQVLARIPLIEFIGQVKGCHFLFFRVWVLLSNSHGSHLPPLCSFAVSAQVNKLYS